MNDDTRQLLREVCNGDISKVQKAAMVLLKNNKAKKDEEFCNILIKKMESMQNLIQLPQNLKGILMAEDVSNYPERKYFWRESESDIAKKVISMYKVSEKLQEKGIRYLPSVILYGESGCGKTELARYIAYKSGLQYVYVRFSSLLDSYLGKTQKNIASLFDYAKKAPCVLCFDEIDAVGLERGQKNEVGEMARILISLMQEIDSLPNNVILIGTTNRFDMLDSALVRRFTIKREIKRLSVEDAKEMSRRFLEYADVEPIDIENYISSVKFSTTASTVIRDCTEFVANKMMEACKNERTEIF